MNLIIRIPCYSCGGWFVVPSAEWIGNPPKQCDDCNWLVDMPEPDPEKVRLWEEAWVKSMCDK